VNRDELLGFLRHHRYCVQASASLTGAPQAAVVGYAVTDALELVFDTLGDTRKMANLRANPRIAIVVGWDEEQTVQLEGTADEPTGTELERLQNEYLRVFPDGVERLAWKGITYVRVTPTWARYSDFRPGGETIEIAPTELQRISITV
jgi:general stress protein 26